MKVNRNRAATGFSLVELLAVVLILAVLAAVAVPLYLNTRRTSAARACKANINAIASAEAAVALRTGTYVTMATLSSTGPESLSAATKCPLDGSAYIFSSTQATNTAVAPGTALMYINCPNAGTHLTDLGGGTGGTNNTIAVTDWQRPMNAITTETTP